MYEHLAYFFGRQTPHRIHRKLHYSVPTQYHHTKNACSYKILADVLSNIGALKDPISPIPCIHVTRTFPYWHKPTILHPKSTYKNLLSSRPTISICTKMARHQPNRPKTIKLQLQNPTHHIRSNNTNVKISIHLIHGNYQKNMLLPQIYKTPIAHYAT